MTSKERTQSELRNKLEQTRERYVRLQRKLEKRRGELDKRTRKLAKLEVEVAALEQQVHNGKDKPGAQAEKDPKALRRARLIFKPTAGAEAEAQAQLKDIVNRLQAHGIGADPVLKTSGKQVRALAKKAAKNGAELLIVAAGDGTIEDAAAGLVGSDTALGIIPIGTMNNLARSWGVPLQVEDACALLGMGLTRTVDVGCVHVNGKSKAAYFLESAGVGLSAIVAPAGQAVEKHHWSVLPKVVRKLFDSEPTNLTLSLDDGDVKQVKSELVTVSNAPLLGKNIEIAPEAKMDDGLLDIATYEGMGKTDLLSYFAAASDGKLAQDARVKFRRAKRVQICSDQSVDSHADKDPLDAQRKLEIEIVPQALRVVVGKGIGLSQPIEAVPSTPPRSGPQKTPPGNGSATPEPQPAETRAASKA